MAATNITSNPYPTGILKPGATYATVSIPVLTNLTVTAYPGTAAYAITIQANSGNTGNIYVCNTAAAPDETNYLNVLYILTAGQPVSFYSGALNTIDCSQIFIGADSATDYATGAIGWR